MAAAGEGDYNGLEWRMTEDDVSQISRIDLIVVLRGESPCSIPNKGDYFPHEALLSLRARPKHSQDPTDAYS